MGQLDNSTVAKFATVQNEGGRDVERVIDYYNLEMIISIGYRVKSQRGIEFRRWANKVLKDYIIKGYAVNDKRLEALQKIKAYLVEMYTLLWKKRQLIFSIL